MGRFYSHSARNVGCPMAAGLLWGLVGCGAGASSSGTGTGTTGVGGAGTSGASSSGSALDTSAATTTGGDVLSYTRDVAPIFKGRCTDCHHQSISVIPNIENPFDAETGLVGSVNTWAAGYPETPALNLLPGNPDESFIMHKISDMNIMVGNFMPWQPARLTADELAALRQWVSAGALNDASFEANIRPIFGVPNNLSSAGGKCTWCHHETGLPPNLENPFDPENGIVNVEAIIGDQLRVAPGDPNSSFLIVKVEALSASPDIGEPMPMQYPPLTATQVETVRRWIVEGAQNN